MDDQTLASLKAALEASPENTKLFAVVVRALLDRGDAAEARRLVDAAPVDRFSGAEDRLLVARVYQRTGDPERALPFADSDEPEALMVRARVLADLGRRDEAKRAYERAVERNPTTEDMSLRALIDARSVETPDGSRRLKVISNDDTDATEVARLLVPTTGKVTFSDVGGLDEVKKHITRKIILPFTKPSIFERFKKRPGGGILMYGPPGCGKTLLARATAGECKAQFFNVAIADVLDMYIGESERKLHAIFDKARSSAPAILFFDELEALAGKRQFSREGTSSKLVSQFLSEMDGFSQNNRGVLILGATNVPWAVDAAFRRAGRFDRVLFVPPPDSAARRAILQALLANRPAEGSIDMDELARRTSGFSGADLDNIVETASDLAIEESLAAGKEAPIREEHLRAALREVKPTTVEWLTTARNYARYANESGQYDEVLAFLDQHGKK